MCICWPAILWPKLDRSKHACLQMKHPNKNRCSIFWFWLDEWRMVRERLKTCQLSSSSWYIEKSAMIACPKEDVLLPIPLASGFSVLILKMHHAHRFKSILRWCGVQLSFKSIIICSWKLRLYLLRWFFPLFSARQAKATLPAICRDIGYFREK